MSICNGWMSGNKNPSKKANEKAQNPSPSRQHDYTLTQTLDKFTFSLLYLFALKLYLTKKNPPFIPHFLHCKYLDKNKKIVEETLTNAEPTSEPVSTAEPTTISEPEPEVTSSSAEPKTSVPEPESTSEPETSSEPEPETSSEPKSEPESEPKSEPSSTSEPTKEPSSTSAEPTIRQQNKPKKFEKLQDSTRK
jgi:hypothetical protein